MDVAADFTSQQTDKGLVILLTGDWTSGEIGDAADRLGELIDGAQAELDLRKIRRCDTAGAT